MQYSDRMWFCTRELLTSPGLHNEESAGMWAVHYYDRAIPGYLPATSRHLPMRREQVQSERAESPTRVCEFDA